MTLKFDMLGAQRRVFESDLKPLERLICLALLDHWSVANPFPFPGVDRLARVTGLDRTAVMRNLTELLQRGALRLVEVDKETGEVRIVTKPRNGARRNYDVRPLASLPVAQSNRSRRATGRAEQPVAQSNITGRAERPQPVAQSNPKEPREGTKEGTHGVLATPTPGRHGRARTRTSETELPPDWQPTAAHRDFAAQHGIDLELEAIGFRGHYDGQKVASWNGRFTTWLTKRAMWNRERGPRKASGAVQNHHVDVTVGATVLT